MPPVMVAVDIRDHAKVFDKVQNKEEFDKNPKLILTAMYNVGDTIFSQL